MCYNYKKLGHYIADSIKPLREELKKYKKKDYSKEDNRNYKKYQKKDKCLVVEGSL